MFDDRDFWEIFVYTLPVYFLVLVTLFTLSFDGGQILAIVGYTVLYSFLTSLLLYRFLKND